MAVAEKYPDVSVIFNDVNMFGEQDAIDEYAEYFTKQKNILSKIQFPSKMLKAFKSTHANLIPTFSCVMAKKDVFKNLDFDSPIKKALDYYLWLQLVKTNIFYYVNKKLTNWRMSKGSYINSENLSQFNNFKFNFGRIYFLYGWSGLGKYILLMINFLINSAVKFYYNDDGRQILEIFGKIFKLKKKFKYSKIEKQFIKNSIFWDSKWYISKYHPDFDEEQTLEYWYSKGWLEGECPSKYFNEAYIDACKNLCHNPIIHYIGKGKRFFPNDYNPYKSEQDKARIEEYLNYKPARKAKGVVYTCITNDYDDIREIEIYGYADKNWDYVCFTDNQNYIEQKQIGIWEIRPLQFSELDNTRNNRWHKLNPHILFPKYSESIYIDPNINILSDKLFEEIKGFDIKLPKHFKNSSIYQEFNDVMRAELDFPELINSELDLIKSSKMPENYGFAENNLIYRKHNLTKIKAIDTEWWEMVKNYAKRDQLSFAFVLWKNGINIKDITFENTRFDVYNFYVFAHKKGRK